MYHTFARSAGFGYWEGLAYTFLGSAFWEIAGETPVRSTVDGDYHYGLAPLGYTRLGSERFGAVDWR